MTTLLPLVTVRALPDRRSMGAPHSSGAPPNSNGSDQKRKETYKPSPPTMAMTSFALPGGAPGTGRGVRCLSEIRSAAANAYTFMASSIGGLIAVWIRPGGQTASSSAAWRSPMGGV